MNKTEEALAFAAETLAPEHQVEHPPMAAPTNEARARILEFERELAALPPFDFPVRHLFPKGIYAREITIPAGCCLTGKIHRFENLNIVSKGRILVATEEGLTEVVAPCTIVSPPGTKRVGYALEDTVWTSIHPNPDDERDLDKLEAMFIVPSFDELKES